MDDNLAAANSTTSDTGVVSPKLGIAFQATDTLELFANYGESFRSPNAVSELRSNPDLEAQKVHSHEVGFRLGGLPFDSDLHASVWYTRQSNEIFNNGGTPENLGKSERNGYDVGVAIPVVRNRESRLTFKADYSFVKARLVGRGTNVFVPTVPTYVTQITVNGKWALANARSLHANLGTQFYGKQHLDSTSDLEADPYYVVTGKLTYSFLDGWSGFGSFRWYPDERYSEIALPVSGVWGTGPQPELTMLFGIGKEF